MQRLVSDLQVTLGQGLMPQFRSGIAAATQGLEAIQNHTEGVATSLGAIGTALAGLVTGRLAGAASRRVQQLAASQSALQAERDAILQTASAATFEANQMARAAAVERSSAESKYQTATAAKTLAVEELQLAQAEQARVAAQYELIRFSHGVATADEAMAAAAERVAAAETAVTAAVDARAIATQTLGTAIQLQNRAEVTAEAATLGYAAAQRNAAAAAGAMGLASRAAGAALSFLGGPIGVASLAIVGLIAYWDELSAAMGNAASEAELSAKRIQTAMAKSDMAGLQQEAGAARRDYDQRNAAYDAFAKRALRPGEYGFQKESDRKAMLAGLETARERLLAADQAVRQLKQRQLVTANALAETDSRKHLGDGKSRLAAQIDQMAKETETKGEKLTAKLATLKRALADGVIDQGQFDRLAARERAMFTDKGATRQAHTAERRAAAAKKKVERYQALMDDLLGKTLHGVDPQYGDNLKLLQHAFSQGKIGAADYQRALQKLTDTQTELGRQTVLFGQRITEVKANLGSAFGQQQLDWQSNLHTENLSARAKEIEQGLQHIGQQAVNLKRRLTEDVKLNLIDPQKMQAGLAEIDAMVAAQQQKYLAYQNTQRAQEADASNGAKQALADYVAAGENASGLMEQAFNSAFSSMDAMINKFVTTGEFSFKQLANSILADIARVAERMAMTKLFQWMGISSGLGTRMTGIPVQAHANGGAVSGAGTATSDSILSWLSNGEYVIKASAVSRYGRGFFDALNAGRLASGGAVGSLPNTPAVSAASGFAVQNNVTINVSSNGPTDTSSDTDLGRTLADKLVPMINKVVQDQMQQQNRDSWRNGGINRQMASRGRT
ncbi:hypothetical protein GCM10007350_11140 [Jeongeupia chitinilytica]|uniref:Bacteriophage tail tape measure C-terminal domain-containing protein n=1 Tax=Jeongeupia chitinilytica TaxID=1041641 RepID=A0ABQ3GZ53_9NEIS|nr:hypothetical protein GCM10007350_11140 [Jeongeupia chitinilytica]